METTSLDLCALLCVCVNSCLAAQHYLIRDLLLSHLFANSDNDNSVSDKNKEEYEEFWARIQERNSCRNNEQSNSISTSSSSSCGHNLTFSLLDLTKEERCKLLHDAINTISVTQKSTLDYKEGDASADFVTSADVIVQSIIMAALRSAFPTLPFTIVAEEEEEEEELEEKEEYEKSKEKRELLVEVAEAHNLNCDNEDCFSESTCNAIHGNSVIQNHVKECLSKYYYNDSSHNTDNDNDSMTKNSARKTIPHEDALRQHVFVAESFAIANGSCRENKCHNAETENTAEVFTNDTKSNNDNDINKTVSSVATQFTNNVSQLHEQQLEEQQEQIQTSKIENAHGSSLFITNDGKIVCNSLQELRERVSIYIDPIDGTACFVNGEWEVPLTMIGVALDGKPVIGVLNKLFDYTVHVTHNDHNILITNTSTDTNGGHESLQTENDAATPFASCVLESDKEQTSVSSSISYVWNVPQLHNAQLFALEQTQEQSQSILQKTNYNTGIDDDNDHHYEQQNVLNGDCNITSHDNVDHHKNSKTHLIDEENNNIATPFIVYKGEVMHPFTNRTHGPLFTSMESDKYNADTVLTVCESSTTKQSFLHILHSQLKPFRTWRARGAGNKQMLLIDSMLAHMMTTKMNKNTNHDNCNETTNVNIITNSKMNNTEQIDYNKTISKENGVQNVNNTKESEVVSCDVFICPPRTIMKWDTCGPHAFIRACHGEVYTQNGEVVKYDIPHLMDDNTYDKDRSKECKSEMQQCTQNKVCSSKQKYKEYVTSLPDGVVAVTASARNEVQRRMK